MRDAGLFFLVTEGGHLNFLKIKAVLYGF